MRLADSQKAPTHGANLKMVDYASYDRRSVAAMLRGCGDGREKMYLSFVKNQRRQDPTRPLSAIDSAYQRRCEFEAWCENLGPRWLVRPLTSCVIWWHTRPAHLFALRDSLRTPPHD